MSLCFVMLCFARTQRLAGNLLRCSACLGKNTVSSMHSGSPQQEVDDPSKVFQRLQVSHILLDIPFMGLGSTQLLLVTIL